MRQRKISRDFQVIAKHPLSEDAPSLADVQADAAPLVAQLLAQAIRKREPKITTPAHLQVLANSSVQA
jgi:hypothetical protein